MRWVLGLKADVVREADRLVAPGFEMRVPDPLSRAVAALTGFDQDEDQLAEQVEPEDLSNWFFFLHRLEARALVRRRLEHAGRGWFELVPIMAAPSPWPVPAPDGPLPERLVLSRFAGLRSDPQGLVLESARSPIRLHLVEAALGTLLVRLARAGPCPAESDLPTRQFLAVLVRANLVVAVDEEGLSAELRDPDWGLWEPHDLHFHWRSRQGRHDYPVGAVFPFRGRWEPLPSRRPALSEVTIELPRADVAGLRLDDRPFTQVLEDRASTRAHGSEPITLQQVGEFLYRAARVRHSWPILPEQGGYYETTSRPYPSGGGTYDIELFLCVSRCRGLDRGLYYYDPFEHRLQVLSGWTDQTESMLKSAGKATSEAGWQPQILITLTSRFHRLSWKYRSWAYSATLRNAGVVYQTLYLVATAMGLAACGAGSGDSLVFEQATGLDYFRESTVGEFLLGSGPDRPYQARDPELGVPVLP